MGKKYNRYKNSLEKFLGSEKGKRYFNFFYSWGASIVIVGALFKINHWRYGTEILVVGMLVEAVIFFISAFDLPAREYKWDRVFPKLNRVKTEEADSDEEDGIVDDVLQEQQQSYVAGGTTIIGSGRSAGQSGTTVNNGIKVQSTTAAQTDAIGGGDTVIGGNITLGSMPIDPTEAAEIQEASENYADQLNKMASSMEKFAETTTSLNQVSDILLNSFKSITDNSEGIGMNTEGYVKQMENLNRNIAGLNTIYEIQLKGVSGQINTIEQINAGLDRIKNLYSGSLADSSIFKSETEKMAHQLADLNQVYARLLQAMTTNMNMSGGFNPNISNNDSQPK